MRVVLIIALSILITFNLCLIAFDISTMPTLTAGAIALCGIALGMQIVSD